MSALRNALLLLLPTCVIRSLAGGGGHASTTRTLLVLIIHYIYNNGSVVREVGGWGTEDEQMELHESSGTLPCHFGSRQFQIFFVPTRPHLVLIELRFFSGCNWEKQMISNRRPSS